jgi:DNA-binding NarL/FixJ family response regulator
VDLSALGAPRDSMNETISLVIIDDNRLLREGLARLIREQKDFHIVAASADADEAMLKVREAKPDVVLLDFGLEDHDSLALTATVHREVPQAKVIVLGLLPLEEDIVSFVRAGASGFIMRDATFEDFVQTIRSVVAGMVVLPPQLTGSLFNQIALQAGRRGVPRELEAVRLTQRERQVIDLIAEGLANKDIATRLHIAVHTVKSHVHNVLEKLALHSRLEVAVFSRSRADRRSAED